MPKIKSGNFESVPAPRGLQQLRCYSIVDIGTQKETYNGEEKETPKYALSFELPATRHAFDKTKPTEKKPFTIHCTVTASFGDRAKIRKWLESMRGEKYGKKVKEVDLRNELLDVPCIGQLVPGGDEGQFTNIQTLLPAVDTKGRAIKVPPLVNKTRVWDYDPEDFDKAGFDELPTKLQEYIKESKEFSIVLNSGALSEGGKPAKKGTKAAPPKKAAKKK
jgi:hypothetical protein